MEKYGENDLQWMESGSRDMQRRGDAWKSNSFRKKIIAKAIIPGMKGRPRCLAYFGLGVVLSAGDHER